MRLAISSQLSSSDSFSIVVVVARVRVYLLSAAGLRGVAGLALLVEVAKEWWRDAAGRKAKVLGGVVPTIIRSTSAATQRPAFIIVTPPAFIVAFAFELSFGFTPYSLKLCYSWHLSTLLFCASSTMMVSLFVALCGGKKFKQARKRRSFRSRAKKLF